MNWINNARIVSTLAVVLLHVSAVVLSENAVGSEYWWFGNGFSSLVRWCVPVFTMISGALLLDPTKQESLSKFYSKRLSRILIPMGFWSLFFLGWTFFHGVIDGAPPNGLELFTNLLSGLPYEHLWFLYMLSGLYLFAPFLRKIIAVSSHRELTASIIFMFVVAGINFAQLSFSGVYRPSLFLNWFLLYIPFFFIGYVIQRDQRTFSQAMRWGTFTLSTLLTCLGYYFALTRNELLPDGYFHGYLSITVIPMSVSVMYLLKSWDKPILNQQLTKQVALLTFGVYLVHPIFVEILNKTNFIRVFHPVIVIPSATALIFMASLFTSWLFHQVPYLRKTI